MTASDVRGSRDWRLNVLFEARISEAIIHYLFSFTCFFFMCYHIGIIKPTIFESQYLNTMWHYYKYCKILFYHANKDAWGQLCSKLNNPRTITNKSTMIVLTNMVNNLNPLANTNSSTYNPRLISQVAMCRRNNRPFRANDACATITIQCVRAPAHQSRRPYGDHVWVYTNFTWLCVNGDYLLLYYANYIHGFFMRWHGQWMESPVEKTSIRPNLGRLLA